MVKNFLLYMTEDMHKELKDIVKELPVTMNKFILQSIQEKIEREKK